MIIKCVINFLFQNILFNFRITVLILTSLKQTQHFGNHQREKTYRECASAYIYTSGIVDTTIWTPAIYWTLQTGFLSLKCTYCQFIVHVEIMYNCTFSWCLNKMNIYDLFYFMLINEMNNLHMCIQSNVKVFKLISSTDKNIES